MFNLLGLFCIYDLEAIADYMHDSIKKEKREREREREREKRENQVAGSLHFLTYLSVNIPIKILMVVV
jgi:hypothetical protein